MWHQRVGVWLGIAFSPASITLGGGLATRVPTAQLMWLVPAGAFVITALVVAQGILSRRRRQTLPERTVATFGDGIGARLLALCIALGMIGYGGFFLGLAGVALQSLFGWPVWVGAPLAATAVFGLSLFGVNRWNYLVWLTTAAAGAMAIVALVGVDGGGDAVPVPAFAPWDGVWALGALIAYAIMFSLRSADFTHDMRRDADIVADGVAFLVTYVAALVIGIVLYRQAGDWNVAELLARTRTATLGQIFLLISIVAPLLSGLHSGSLSLVFLLRLRQRYAAVIICTIGGLLGALRFDNQLLPFLDSLGAILPAALVVMWRLSFRPAADSVTPRRALYAWLLGAAAAVTVQAVGFEAHLFVGAAVAAIVPLGKEKVKREK